ncbi:MAG: HlyC/CorC family transporter [Deltaproteobacteria bacterium]|nr:HlyC/CorC family transporter [Deltaproteobacteria bacterium]
MSEPAIESQLAQHALSVDLLGLLAVGILVLANGYFVATEFALVAVRRSQIQVWVGEGRRGAQAASDAIDRLDDAIAATQLGITIASIGLGWVGESVVSSLLSAPLEWLGIESRVALHTIATLIAFTLITFLHVVVGELAPKAIALQRPGEVAILFAQPLLVFGRVFRWVLVAMNGTGNALVRLAGFHAISGHQVHSAEELHLLVSEAHAAGTIRPEQGKILGKVFKSASKRVRDVMIPRERIFSIPVTTDPETLLDRLREEGYTRLPVFDGDLDRVVGILHTKDLFISTPRRDSCCSPTPSGRRSRSARTRRSPRRSGSSAAVADTWRSCARSRAG